MTLPTALEAHVSAYERNLRSALRKFGFNRTEQDHAIGVALSTPPQWRPSSTVALPMIKPDPSGGPNVMERELRARLDMGPAGEDAASVVFGVYEQHRERIAASMTRHSPAEIQTAVRRELHASA